MAHAVQMKVDNARRSLNNNVNSNNRDWYAIYTPQPSVNNSNNPRVFTDLTEAIAESKKLGNARFNRFTSESDARKFAETGQTDSPAIVRSRPHLQENKEKSPARKGAVSSRVPMGDENQKTCPPVHQRDLNKFRMAIEKGDKQTVLDLIKGNPRYLISNESKPVTIQLSAHYNALHCAAIKGQKEVAEEIMNYLLSDKPWETLYPNEDTTNASHQERRSIVIDGFLNTCDTGWGETPLHFACKNGHLKFVEWLLSFNKTDISQLNKQDQSAEDVAGTRCADPEGVRREVSVLIQQSRHSVYVPVVRAVDNSTPPFLGQPVTPEYIHSKRGSLSSSEDKKILLDEFVSESDSFLSADFDTSLADTSFTRTSIGTLSPLRPSLSICAYAGPLPAANAKEFRKLWKTPPRELPPWRRDTLQNIMRSDSDRGLERVGRDLAIQKNVAWREYWDFLGDFVNLREEDGLQRLDNYLLNCDHQFISGDNPSKMDQDVLHALPQAGIAQLSDKFPNICYWYNMVLMYPEDERKCWTTPIPMKKSKSRRNGSSAAGHLREDDDVVVARNLLSAMSLGEESPAENTSSDKDIQDILTEGVSKLSLSETNKHFSKTYTRDPNLCNIDIIEQSTALPITPVSHVPPKERLPLPISSHVLPRDNTWLVGTSSEPRQRYPKSSIVETDGGGTAPRGSRVRRYFSHQIIRWILIFVFVWTIYFIFVYFQLDNLVTGNDYNRHL